MDSWGSGVEWVTLLRLEVYPWILNSNVSLDKNKMLDTELLQVAALPSMCVQTLKALCKCEFTKEDIWYAPSEV